MNNLIAHPGVQILFVAVFIVLFYFLLLKPQQKRVQAHTKLIDSLEIGTRIVTAGGFFGTVTEIDEDVVAIELAPKVKVRIQKSAVEALA